MSAPEIQRYDLYFNPHGEDYIKRMVGGQFVTYADHVAALAAAVADAEQQGRADAYAEHIDYCGDGGWRKGVSDERERIHKAVESLTDPVPDVERTMWTINEVLAVIDNDEEGR